MSVYTTVTPAELAHFLQSYSVGTLIQHSGILAGIENTNYHVSTSQGQFVLTLFEQHQPSVMPYFLHLMHYWAKQGIPTPCPIPTQSGELLHYLNGKPATLVLYLQGVTVEYPTALQCAAVGQWLARMHLTGKGFHFQRLPDRGHSWRMQTGRRLLDDLPQAEQTLLHTELAFQDRMNWQALPTGTIHADLFRDNVLFVGDQLTGILDLYYACDDSWLYDLAIVINDWCYDDTELNLVRFQACLKAYHALRPLTALEQSLAVGVMRAAALRFWLSRLSAKLNPPSGSLTFLKNPDEFKNKLIRMIDESAQLQAHWHAI